MSDEPVVAYLAVVGVVLLRIVQLTSCTCIVTLPNDEHIQPWRSEFPCGCICLLTFVLLMDVWLAGQY